MLPALSASSTVPSSAVSAFTLGELTCTAGTSGKKLGSVYRMPTTNATAITMYFQGV